MRDAKKYNNKINSLTLQFSTRNFGNILRKNTDFFINKSMYSRSLTKFYQHILTRLIFF